jgi:hypothetical protein
LHKADEIESRLKIENEERKRAAKSLLEDALREARVFVNGGEINYSGKDIKTKISVALNVSVTSVYHKLYYIDAALGIDNIRSLFTPGSPPLIPGGCVPNRYALDEVRSFIESNSQKHQKTSMRTLQDRFMREPFGFVEDDVEWLCAKLFKDGDIDVFISNAQITVQDKTENELVNFFTKKQYADALTTGIRRKANDIQLKITREIMKALFNDSAPDDDEDTLFHNFKEHGKELMDNLKDILNKYQICPEYPQKNVIEDGYKILNSLLSISSPFVFFGEISQKKDELLNFCDDFESLKIFFSGSQSGIFKDAAKAAQSFERNKYAIYDKETFELATQISAITGMANPYKEISALPELIDKYGKSLADQCQKTSQPILVSLEKMKEKIKAGLEGKPYKDEVALSLVRRFDAMEQKVRNCAEPCLLDNMVREIDRLNTDMLNEIDKKEAELAIKDEDSPPPKMRRTNHVSIRSLVSSPAWRIETEDEIEAYLAQLRHRILTEMKDDYIISVEF